MENNEQGLCECWQCGKLFLPYRILIGGEEIIEYQFCSDYCNAEYHAENRYEFL